MTLFVETFHEMLIPTQLCRPTNADNLALLSFLLLRLDDPTRIVPIGLQQRAPQPRSSSCDLPQFHAEVAEPQLQAKRSALWKSSITRAAGLNVEGGKGITATQALVGC